jgi:hypothetical protein
MRGTWGEFREQYVQKCAFARKTCTRESVGPQLRHTRNLEPDPLPEEGLPLNLVERGRGGWTHAGGAEEE